MAIGGDSGIVFTPLRTIGKVSCKPCNRDRLPNTAHLPSRLNLLLFDNFGKDYFGKNERR
jgi:hypothetical protein